MILEYAYYTVISPEGCAAILYKNAAKAEQAANSLRLTAQDLLDLKIIDEIINEPFGGAHRHRLEVIQAVGKSIENHLQAYDEMDPNTIRITRQQKFLNMTRTLNV